MAVGLRQYKNGVLVLDGRWYTGKPLGIITMTDGVNSSVTNAAFSQGTPWWVATPMDWYAKQAPLFSFAGTTLSWTWPTYSGGVNFQLKYGVY